MDQSPRAHIFAINGHSESLNLIRELFEEESSNLTTANFVPNTFAQITPAQPDLLIVELAPRGDDRSDLLERLHAETATAGVPVLVVSTAPGHIKRARDRVALSGGLDRRGKP